MDVVDLKLNRHMLLNAYNDYEIVMVLYNNSPKSTSLNHTAVVSPEGMFKNTHIDTIRAKNGTPGMDKKKTVLADERYKLNVSHFI